MKRIYFLLNIFIWKINIVEKFKSIWSIISLGHSPLQYMLSGGPVHQAVARYGTASSRFWRTGTGVAFCVHTCVQYSMYMEYMSILRLYKVIVEEPRPRFLCFMTWSPYILILFFSFFLDYFSSFFSSFIPLFYFSSEILLILIYIFFTTFL